MDQPKINYVAVGAASIAMWFIGWGWYSAFGAQWMSYTGVTEEMTKNMTGMDWAVSMGGSLVAYFIMFYCLEHVNHAFKVKDMSGAIQGAFWTWLGYIATVIFVTNVYQGKPFGLWLIDAGYWLVGIIVGGIILLKMKKKEAAA